MTEGLFLWLTCVLENKKLVPLCVWVHMHSLPRHCVSHSGYRCGMKNAGILLYFPQRLEGPLYLVK